MFDLDDLKAYAQGDPQGMGDRIAEMAFQLEEAQRLISAFPQPGAEYTQARQILVLGMGGSAIGGDLVRTLAEGQLRVPMAVSREYRLPGYVGPVSLVIASSYSGNTEETLSATQEALDRGARVMAVTTGGQLGQLAQQQGLPLVRFQYSAQPRAAVGFSFGLLLGLLNKLGYLNAAQLGLDEAKARAKAIPGSLGPQIPTGSNPAKQVALRLHGKLPVVYGAGLLSEVARRWKGQFNENAKAWAYYEQLPELNHNAVVGYENPADMAGRLYVILLSSSSYHPRVAARVRITGEILQQRGVAHEVVNAGGSSPMAQMVDSIMTGDYVSYYLTLLYGSDPTPVKVIDFLKQQLSALQ